METNDDNTIKFHELTLADKALVQSYTLGSMNRNCDMNFMNLFSWRFLYSTEVGEWNGWLVFRFYADGHLAYLVPVGEGDWKGILEVMRQDSHSKGHPFLFMGVREHYLPALEEAMPDYFNFTYARNYSDYVYEREKLATLSGKKLQSRRNFINRFIRLYPDHEYKPLTPELIPLCKQLADEWMLHKEAGEGIGSVAAEHRSIQNVFDHWEELEAIGGTLFVGGKLVAFTFGGPINGDTFDVCVEKADTNYEGAFAMINREFAAHIPTQYTYMNREEDMGDPGLRTAKMHYHPVCMINKYAVMAKRPFAEEQQ